MLKGISMNKRNNAWHSRNTRSKAKKRIDHAARLLRYKIGSGAAIQSIHKQSKKKHMDFADKVKAHQDSLGWLTRMWNSIKLFINNLFKRTNAVS